MKRSLHVIVMFLCSLMISFSFAGCGGGKKGSGNFTIRYYLGGYGQEWAKALASKFEEETGIIVDLAPDAGILSTLENNLKNGINGDLFFSHDITWERYAALGYLEPLDDLYSTKVSGNTTFADRVSPIALNSSKILGSYYKVPWTKGVGGIAYNVKMFETYGWSVPQTYQELETLCATIAAKPASETGGKKITPFVWAGLDSWWWDYPVYEWWAQLAGTEKIAELMKYESPETFNPDTNWKELKEAFTAWYNLIALHPEYSLTGSTGLTKTTAPLSFLDGSAAMMPNAHWLYNETLNRAPAGFEMAIMDTPVLANAKEGYEKVNYLVGFGDSAIISKKSKNKDAAKKFLEFMSREDNCKLFTEKTNGTYLAYEYSIDDSQLDNKFVKSVNDKLKNSKSFHTYSNNQMSILLFETLMVWPENNYYYVSAFNSPSKNTPKMIFDYIYSVVNDNWANWKTQAGL